MVHPSEMSIVGHFEFSIIVPFRLWTAAGQAPDLPECVKVLTDSDLWREETEGDRVTDPIWDRARRYQADAYFHPFVRQFIHNPDHCRRLVREEVRTLTFIADVRPWEPRALKRNFSVDGCSLWLFDLGVGVLRLDLTALPNKDAPWSLRDVLLALDQLRRLYPPYFFGEHRPEGSGHCPHSIEIVFNDDRKVAGDYRECERFIDEARTWLQSPGESKHSFPWARHWQELLAPLLTTPPATGTATGMRAMHMGDDRAPVMSLIAFVDKETLEWVSRGDWVRLCFANEPGTDGLPYQREFLAKFEKRYCYDRFWYRNSESTDSPSRIMNCGYAFTWVGSATDEYYFMDEKIGARATFRNIYVPMGVIAHFHRAALLVASAQLSALIDRQDREGNEDRLQKLYQRFIRFTQVFWFDEISPQEQGRELFAVWRRELRTQELFDEVRQELRDMTDLQNAEAQIAQAWRGTRLTQIALPFAIISLAVSFVSMWASLFGMNTFGSEDIARIGLTQDIHFGMGALAIVVSLVVLLSVLLLLVWGIYVLHRMWRTSRPRSDRLVEDRIPPNS